MMVATRLVGRHHWRALLAIGIVLWLAFAGLPGGALSTGPERAQADAGDCAAAVAAAGIAAGAAAQNPTALNKAAAATAAANAIRVCWKGYKGGGPPPRSDGPPSDNPPNTTPPKIDPPGEEPTPPEDGSGGHPCEATVSVSYGVGDDGQPLPPAPNDPPVATTSLAWGDGTSTTQTVAWGSAMTVTHNYYYSTSPYPRLAPGQGWDDDPQGDGSDEYPLQATVLETGARSGYGFVEHVGPFPGGSFDPPMPGTTSATRPGTTSATRPDSRAWPPSPGASSATSPTLLGPPPLSTTAR